MENLSSQEPRQEDYMALDDAISRFGVSERTISGNMRELGIEKIKIDNKYWIHKSDFAKLRNHRQSLFNPSKPKRGRRSAGKIPDLLEDQAYAPTTDADDLNLSDAVESADGERQANGEPVSNSALPPNEPTLESGSPDAPPDAPSEIPASDNEISSDSDEEQVNVVNNSAEAAAQSNSVLSVPLQPNAVSNSEIVVTSSAESPESDAEATLRQESRMEQINRQRDSKLAFLKANQRVADTLISEEIAYSHLLENPQDLLPETKEIVKQKMLEEEKRRAEKAKKPKSDAIISTIRENWQYQSSEDDFFGEPSTSHWDLE